MFQYNRYTIYIYIYICLYLYIDIQCVYIYTYAYLYIYAVIHVYPRNQTWEAANNPERFFQWRSAGNISELNGSLFGGILRRAPCLISGWPCVY